ncbi:MAG: alpha/beta hydrolase [Actinomycetota bacterium]|nr:alpha/beta hydrolase [Actinomycetota bacterium]
MAASAALTDIAVGVRWLRQAGVETVVILGNSGGASLMSAYQAERAGTPDAGDLFVSLCAHPGRPDVLTAWLDPSVTDESDPSRWTAIWTCTIRKTGRRTTRSSSLDTARLSGTATNGSPHGLGRLQAAGATDRLFNVPRTWADPRFLDLTLEPTDRPPGCYRGDPRRANYGSSGLAASCTLRGWMSMWSLSTSPCRAELHLPRITHSALIIQSAADQGVYPSDARAIHAGLASTDRTLAMVAGDHYLIEPPGARQATAELIAEWIGARTLGHGRPTFSAGAVEPRLRRVGLLRKRRRDDR